MDLSRAGEMPFKMKGDAWGKTELKPSQSGSPGGITLPGP